MSWLGTELILDSLEELSSKEIQEKLWLSCGNGEVSSFSEAVESLLTDSGLSDALDRNSTGYPSEIVEMLVDLRDILHGVDRSENPAAIIDSSAMTVVRRKAEAILLLCRPGD